MNRPKCYANWWIVFISGFMVVSFAGNVTTVIGDEPKDIKYERLEQLLHGMSNEQLRSLAEDGAVPITISELDVSPDPLNNALIKELARRLETPKMLRAEAAEVKGTEIADSKGGAGDNLNGKNSVEDMLESPAEIKLANVAVETFSGEPFAVSMVELEYEAGHGPLIYPDQPLFLDSTDQRAHYISFDLSYQQITNKPTMMVDRLRVLFLLRGSQPCQVSLSSVTGTLLEEKDIEPNLDGDRYNELLNQWWKQFSVIPTSYGREQRELKESLLDMLARRLQLAGPWPNNAKNDAGTNETSLEHQFERGIGMLFGIESVQLAMRADVALSQSGRSEKADQAIPMRPILPSVWIPQAPPTTWIEPIAMHVPAECFYLRTGSLANYRQFRRFLLGWGGSLNDIVSTNVVDHQSRVRLEGQLGLSPDQFAQDDFDKLIADMALIGCDPMFDDGASIGVLFQASNSNDLANVLKAQRNQARSRVPESHERRVTIDGHDVSFLTSDDHSIRSYYAIDGDFHLVTNSYYLLSRFFQTRNGLGSLGKLNEFRYARYQTNQISKKYNQKQPLAMLYLSDPFFQNLISPHYRIELTRRRQAAQELKQFQLARMIAKAEHIDAVTTDQLIESELLPYGFGIRPDGSYPMLEEGKLRDSQRGALGYFVPIPDMPLQKATPTEVIAYRQFLAQYAQEWRRIDPVTVVLSRDKSDKDDLQKVGLDIIITPYAQQHYELLSRYLAPASDARVAPMNSDLISLDTSIRGDAGSPNSHLLYLGLRDDDVPFLFENGQIKLVNRSKGSTYAKRNSYAAISPPSTSVLKILASAFDRVQRQEDVQSIQADRARTVPPREGGTFGFNLFSLFISNAILKSSDAIQYANFVSSNDNWMVASTSRALRQTVLNEELSPTNVGSSPQVRLRVKSLSNSKAEPYIQAYAYLAARKASSENARFLNDISSWLRLPINETRESVETILGAQLCCPLGGDFNLREIADHSYWAGTQWPEISYFTETKTPPSWKFAFLDWLRGLDLRFDIDRTTLRAHVDLLVLQPAEIEADKQWTPLMLHGPSKPANAASMEETTVVVPSGLQPVQNWVLGIRIQSGVQPFRITSIYPNSPASWAGLSVGDQILEIDRVKPESREHLVELIESARTGKNSVSVRLIREGSRFDLEIPWRNR